MKQESLEEAALKYASKKLDRLIIPYKELDANVAEYVGFTNGAKWAQERMYSEEEVIRILDKREDYLGTEPSIFDYLTNKEWFEQFKKK